METKENLPTVATAGNEIIEGGRRNLFVKAMSGAIIAAAGIGLAAKAAHAQTITDVDILNFALNLEYLEAEFYHLATTGNTLSLSGYNFTGTGTKGQVVTKTGTNTAIPAVTFSNASNQAFALELAADELNHVLFLRSALTSAGPGPVAEPQIDLVNSFNAAAAAAGIGATFDPFASEANFLLGSYIFEDVGVTAYQGAGPAITNKAGYLGAAAGILAVEAYHAASIRTRLIQATVSGSAPTAAAISNQISALRAKLAGNTATDDFGVGNAGAFIVNDDNTSGAVITLPGGPAVIGGTFPRTTTQVLNIVYGATNKIGVGGGFFPVGMNGTIR